ncbi:MAG TPA: hypothetical protein VIK80_02930 [Flavihumibacter sp.]|jgi:hypothetical protein
MAAEKSNDMESLRGDLASLTGLAPTVFDGGRETLSKVLATWLNDLIIHNFEGLIQILYRVDINESHLKQLLSDNPTRDAAGIMAELIIDRQIEKIKLRRQFKQPPPEDEEERW